MTKKIFVLLLLLGILGGALYWEPLACSLLHRGIVTYCRHQLGSEFAAKPPRRCHGCWVFDKVVLRQKNSTLAAERLSIGFGLDVWKRTAFLDVFVGDSTIDLQEELTDFREAFADVFAKSFPYWLFKLNTTFIIHKGTVRTGSDGKISHADFRFYAHSDDHDKRGEVALYLDGKQKASNFFDLLVVQEGKHQLQSTLRFRDVECEKISRLSGMFGQSLHGWCIEGGKANGTLQLMKREKGRIYTWGDALLTDIAFSNSKKGVKGLLQEVALDLEFQRGKKEVPCIVGKASLKKEASVRLEKHGAPVWELDNLVGEIQFLPDTGITASLLGLCRVQKQVFGVKVTGDGNVFDETQAAGSLQFVLMPPAGEEAKCRIVARQLGALYNCAEIELENFGVPEFAFLQQGCGHFFPVLRDVRMCSGKVDLFAIAYMRGFKPAELKIERMAAKDVKFDIEPFACSVAVPEVSGNAALDLSAREPLETLNADIYLSNGRMDLAGANGRRWHFHRLNTGIQVKNGVVQQSEMQGEFLGLQGDVFIDWMSDRDFMRFRFEGGGEKLADLLPQRIKPSVLATFYGDHVSLEAATYWKEKGAALSGVLEVVDAKTRQKEKIAFGFDMEKSSEKLWKRWPADALAIAYWDSVGLEAMQAVIPPLAYPAILLESNWIKSESGIAGLVVRNGWFRGDSLRLERFVSPFVLPRRQLFLKGKGTFFGAFDHSRMAVEYEAEDAVLTNDQLAIEVKEVRGKAVDGSKKKAYASHFFDFEKGTHFGTLPLENALYFDKGSGLLFSDIRACIVMEQDKIHVQGIETTCNGLALAGNIDIVFGLPDDDVFDVSIHAEKAEGTLAQVQHLFHHFSPEISFLNAPFEANISLRAPGAKIVLAFNPKDYRVQAEIFGAVSRGRFSLYDGHFLIDDVGFDFAYSHGKGTLEFSGIRGKVHGDGETYGLVGEHVKVRDFAHPSASFDVWIGNGKQEFMRVAGNSSYVQDSASPGIDIVLNTSLTHFGSMHPEGFRFKMKDLKTLDTFSVTFRSPLENLVGDLLVLADLGVFPFEWNVSKALKGMQNPHGAVEATLAYNVGQSGFSFRLDGKGVGVGQQAFDTVRVKLARADGYWNLEEFHLDDLWMHSYLAENGDSWRVSNLDMHYGDAFSMAFDGEYLPGDKVLKGRTESLFIDLGRMKGGGSTLQTFLTACYPHGRMKGAGELTLHFPGQSPGWRVEAILDSCLEQWDVKGLYFQDAHNVSCHYVSDKGVTLRNLSAGLIDAETGAFRGQLHIEKAAYDFAKDETHFENVAFKFPSHHLPWLARTLTKSFPGLVVPPLADAIGNAKLQGNFEGSLSCDLVPPYSALRMTLAEGTYQFLNCEHDLRDVVMEYDPFEFKAVATYLLGGNSVRLNATSTSPTLSHGELEMSNASLEAMGSRNINDALYVVWDNDASAGFSIRSAEGNYTGLNVRLARDPNMPLSDKAIYLVGEVDVDARQAKALFPLEFAQKIDAWKAGDGYRLNGRWSFQKAPSQDYASKIHFAGKLEGRQFALKGYRFNAMQADLEYTPSSVKLDNLSVDDVCGRLTAGSVAAAKGSDGIWHYAIPEMTVERFAPSLLREEDIPQRAMRRPFTVQRLTLVGCEGNMADSSSLAGKGVMHFTNRSPKFLQNTIFNVPADILSRLGLDLSVLTPVTGSVEYVVAGDKIYLTRLREVCSEGKLSKFHLYGKSPSHIDFDGNLNLQVRIKQNNLLFKLAELFTFDIHGTLQRPTYALHKQNKSEP